MKKRWLAVSLMAALLWTGTAFAGEFTSEWDEPEPVRVEAPAVQEQPVVPAAQDEPLFSSVGSALTPEPAADPEPVVYAEPAADMI